MKRTTASITILLIMPLLFFSCQKVKESIKIYIPVSMVVDIVVPPLQDSGVMYEFDGFSILDMNELIQERNSMLTAKNIRSVTIKSMDINIAEDTQFSQDNFTALELFYVSLSSNQNPAVLSLIHFQDHH